MISPFSSMMSKLEVRRESAVFARRLEPDRRVRIVMVEPQWFFGWLANEVTYPIFETFQTLFASALSDWDCEPPFLHIYISIPYEYIFKSFRPQVAWQH